MGNGQTIRNKEMFSFFNIGKPRVLLGVSRRFELQLDLKLVISMLYLFPTRSIALISFYCWCLFTDWCAGRAALQSHRAARITQWTTALRLWSWWWWMWWRGGRWCPTLHRKEWRYVPSKMFISSKADHCSCLLCLVVCNKSNFMQTWVRYM